MEKRLICIECPKGCALTVALENGKVGKVTGNKCPKGIGYAVAEIEEPMRILTATVLAERLSVKLVPVRTDRPLPKARLRDAMELIRTVKVTKPVTIGDVIVPDLLGLGVDLVATRSCA